MPKLRDDFDFNLTRKQAILVGGIVGLAVLVGSLRNVIGPPPEKKAQPVEYAPFIEPQNENQEPYSISKIHAAIFVSKPIHLSDGTVVDLDDDECLAEIPGNRNVVRVYREVSYKNYKCLETDLTKREFKAFVSYVNENRRGFRLANPDK